jgi:hypothetical protein
MKIFVITNCTRRKALVVRARQTARRLPKGRAQPVAEEWACRIRQASRWVPANRLYQGRGFSEATKAAVLAATPLHVVSAGLGFVSETDLIPPYSLTASIGSPDSIQAKLEDGDIADWWRCLNGARLTPRSLTEWGAGLGGGLVVLALTPTYLQLIERELLGLSAAVLDRLRIVGVRKADLLPERLRGQVLPYDRRLNGPDSPFRGTESDFPQRAAHHFVGLSAEMRRFGKSCTQHAQLVKRSLYGWRYPEKVSRRVVTDEELRRAIRKAGLSGRGWTAALRALRDELNIACEQHRFRALYQEITNNL